MERSPSRSLAVAATVLAAAPRQIDRDHEGSVAVALTADDVRVHERRAPTGNLAVFVIDSSGSMGARRRMESVKGIVLGMLTAAYQKRDRVALIAFRGQRAELLLPPTSSVERAEQCLSQLPTGGRTPLADGLRLALETIDRAAQVDRSRPCVVLITDGRSNVAASGIDALTEARQLGEEIAARGLSAVVVDTEEGRLRLGLAEQIARSMSARCVRLSQLESGDALNPFRL